MLVRRIVDRGYHIPRRYRRCRRRNNQCLILSACEFSRPGSVGEPSMFIDAQRCYDRRRSIGYVDSGTV